MDGRLQEPKFPAWPVGWYTVARSRDLPRGGRLARRLAGAEVVLFRGHEGEVAAVAAACPHMGTHLRHGEVVGDRLRCPMHHWSFGADGAGEKADGARCRPLRVWPVAERYGLIFVAVGLEQEPDLPPLPAPADLELYAWRSGGPIEVATSWFSLMVSGFDMEHLGAVHHRQLVGPPTVELLDGGRRLRLAYCSKVAGGHLADRVMGWLGRDGIHVTMTCSGPIFVVETRIGRRRTSAILGLLPVERGVAAYGSFAISRRSWWLGLQLRLTAWLFVAFLRKDFAIIEGIDLRTAEVRDVGVRAMADFLAALPEAAKGERDG